MALALKNVDKKDFLVKLITTWLRSLSRIFVRTNLLCYLANYINFYIESNAESHDSDDSDEPNRQRNFQVEYKNGKFVSFAV